MESRDILNHLGVKIGVLELPSGTPEEVWAKKLSVYAQPPKIPTPKEMIAGKLQEYRLKSERLIDELLAENTLQGITTQQSDQMFDDFLDVLIRIRNGAFPTALYRLSQKQPTGFATQELIDSWTAKIKEYL